MQDNTTQKSMTMTGDVHRWKKKRENCATRFDQQERTKSPHFVLVSCAGRMHVCARSGVHAAGARIRNVYCGHARAFPRNGGAPCEYQLRRRIARLHLNHIEYSIGSGGGCMQSRVLRRHSETPPTACVCDRMCVEL